LSLCARADLFFETIEAFIAGERDRVVLFSRMRLLEEFIRNALVRIGAVYEDHERNLKRVHDRLQVAILIGLFLSVILVAAAFALTGLPMIERALDEAERANRASRREAAEARRLQREAEKADRFKTEFLARLSHEVRTPLNAVIGLADLVASAHDRSEDRERLSLIRRNGEALSSMFEDMIDLALVTSGELRLEPSAFDLAALVESVGDAHRRCAEAKGVRLEFAIDTEAWGVWVGDARRVRRIAAALVGNAVKFTPRGRIRIGLSRWGDSGVRLSVDDSGPGVPAARREEIFRIFTQMDGSATRAFGGLGQGLSLVRAIAQAMGGAAGVTGSDLGGARFYVLLPLLSLARTAPAGSQRDASRSALLTEYP
jgi:signal transduction histidine kinase